MVMNHCCPSLAFSLSLSLTLLLTVEISMIRSTYVIYNARMVVLQTQYLSGMVMVMCNESFCPSFFDILSHSHCMSPRYVQLKIVF